VLQLTGPSTKNGVENYTAMQIARHGAGIAVVRQRTGFPSDDIVEVRAQPIVAFLYGMAGPTAWLTGMASNDTPEPVVILMPSLVMRQYFIRGIQAVSCV
jgi:hypothetical protein